MARTTSQQESLTLEAINGLLRSTEKELLDKTVTYLHSCTQSSCTSVIEIDPNTAKVTLLASSNIKVGTQHSQLVPVSRHNGQFELKESHEFTTGDLCFLSSNVEASFLNKDRNQAYIAIPIKSADKHTLGLILSTFSSTMTIRQHQNVVNQHHLYAQIIANSLRVKWLSVLSEDLNAKLSYETSHDKLTGLFNRISLSEKLGQLTENHHFTLAYVDIEKFKYINDLYGNYIGDQVIKFVAETIQGTIENKQLAFRIAGDEFAFITFSKNPLMLCNQILKRFKGGYKDPTHNIKFNVKIGLAGNNHHRTTAEQLIHNASLALKDCKQSRYLNVQCYDTHLSKQYYRRALIIDSLRNELTKENMEDSEIYVVVQPIVGKPDKQWDYFEVLARWESPTLGSISPVEFIEAAEQSGLIVELGEHIIKLACQAKFKLQTGLGRKIKLSINCSAHELNRSNQYLQSFLNALKPYKFSPEDFTIELTETVLLSQTEEIQRVLTKLRLIGFKIALDDFGTGYSSLNYIHRYPIDCIKIDATFIKNIRGSRSAERVVWLIIQLAKQLNVSLVAEGVEEKPTLDKLYKMGCNRIQGYFFSKPKTPEEIINLQKEKRCYSIKSITQVPD
jgi:diguanylate cyclase (GGDEF)-like protein